MRDTIYRDDALRVANGFCHPANVAEELAKLPSAQPERKPGRWIKISPADIYECSECGKNVMTADIDTYGFCHGCGAKMEGGEHETD